MQAYIRKGITTVFVPAAALVLWQIIAVKLDNPVVLPTVDAVFSVLLNPFEELLSMGSLIQNILISLWRVLIGFFLATVIAVPLGIIMGYNQTVFTLLHQSLGLIRPIPPLAWVPLVLAWFGIASVANLFGIQSGEAYLYLRNIKLSMIFIIFIGAFFPVLTSAIYGVQSVRKILIDSALVLGAAPHQVFRSILLPAALPSIVNGMRIGLGVAWMCLVSAEMLPGSIAGVGYLITHAYTVARTEIVIAGMVSIGIIGTILDAVFRLVSDRKFAWQRLSR